MTWQIATTLSVLGLVILGITFLRASPYLILCGGLTVLIVTDVVDADTALHEGFGNSGVITVALLFVVADGLNRTGSLAGLGQRLLGRSADVRAAQLRTMTPVAVMSAFLNNTPVVALMMPIVIDWAKKNRISVSSLLMPLSFAAILGGMCTLVGTSTTLVIASKLPEGHVLGMFDLAVIGIPATLLGMAWMILSGRWLLPGRKPAFTKLDDPREYTVEMKVEPGSQLVGKTIEDAGLRHLPGMYLMEIDRRGTVHAAVSSDTRLEADDQLIFVGIVESVVDLQRIPGLKPATNQLFKLQGTESRGDRCLVEAVVSNTCPYLRMTIREARFRAQYNAAVIAVARDGSRVRKKIGDIVLTPGDTLLLETHPAFIEEQRNSRHFFLVSEVAGSNPPKLERAWTARCIMLLMIMVVAFELLPMLKAALIAAGLMIMTRCTRGSTALRAVDWDILIVMAAGLGIGEAMKSSGTDEFIANGLVHGAGEAAAQFYRDHPRVLLALICGLTMVLTNLITAKAAGLLVLPIALSAAETLGVNLMPFAIAVIIGAATSFATPIGYQTNLMVYGPGGYRSSDFLRVGGPLSVLVWALTIVVAPMIWPFQGG